MPPLLHIRLFGSLDMRLGGDPLPPIESARAASLLVWLLLHREAPQPRQHLAFLLWPDSSESQARTNLRHLIHTVRRALPEADRYLAISPGALQWRGDAHSWLDVVAFDAALEKAADPDESLAALQEAIDLYRGDLLAGSYDDWLTDDRERYRRRYGEALERLLALLEPAGETALAMEIAERLVRHDPLHEGAYRALMRLHAVRGERARALRVFHVCAATLERELGIEPADETRDLHNALLATTALLPMPAERMRHEQLTSLVGRGAEWMRLGDRWRATQAGQAHVVLITGEAGIGKSRLAEEFRHWCAEHGAATARTRAYPAEGLLAYEPVVAWLRMEPLASHVMHLNATRREALARLLPEIALEDGLPGKQPATGDDQRQRLFDAAASAILAHDAPLLLVLDDLHWCDRETLQFLHYLARIRPDAPLLVVATARTEELEARPAVAELLDGLRALECLDEIPLGRLSEANVVDLVSRLSTRLLADADGRGLYQATEGNPLFVVEALRAGWADGAQALDWMTPRVQAVIGARLSQLSVSTRALLGLAATIGRAFTAEMLGRAAALDEADLVRGLDELWRRRIVREQGIDAYDFSHDLLREAAYRALGPAQRRHNHVMVARALEMLHEADPGAAGGQIAAHYDRAGAIEPAIGWYERAAESALHRYANLEAIRLLERALELQRPLPRTPARIAREAALLAALLPPLGIAEGYSSPRLKEVHQQALAVTSAPDAELASPVLRSLAIASLTQGDFAAARHLGELLRTRGAACADNVLLVESAYLLGIAAFWQGELPVARQWFEDAIARYRPESSSAHLQYYGLDPRVICLSRLATTLWLLGHPAEAEAARDDALALAEKIGHPATQATAWVFAAFLALDMDDLPKLRQFAGLLTPSRREREGRPTELTAEAFAGYLDVLDGRPSDALDHIASVLDEPAHVGHAPGMRATIARLLVAACAVSGNAAAGLAMTERALRMGAVRLWEPEIRRLRAEFLAANGAPLADVAAELDRALDSARQQGAVAFELRVHASRERLGLDRR